MPCVGLGLAIEAFPGHTHLLLDGNKNEDLPNVLKGVVTWKLNLVKKPNHIDIYIYVFYFNCMTIGTPNYEPDKNCGLSLDGPNVAQLCVSFLTVCNLILYHLGKFSCFVNCCFLSKSNCLLDQKSTCIPYFSRVKNIFTKRPWMAGVTSKGF